METKTDASSPKTTQNVVFLSKKVKSLIDCLTIGEVERIVGLASKMLDGEEEKLLTVSETQYLDGRLASTGSYKLGEVVLAHRIANAVKETANT